MSRKTVFRATCSFYAGIRGLCVSWRESQLSVARLRRGYRVTYAAAADANRRMLTRANEDAAFGLARLTRYLHPVARIKQILAKGRLLETLPGL
jgi:hypothetical protein